MANEEMRKLKDRYRELKTSLSLLDRNLGTAVDPDLLDAFVSSVRTLAKILHLAEDAWNWLESLIEKGNGTDLQRFCRIADQLAELKKMRSLFDGESRSILQAIENGEISQTAPPEKWEPIFSRLDVARSLLKAIRERSADIESEAALLSETGAALMRMILEEINRNPTSSDLVADLEGRTNSIKELEEIVKERKRLTELLTSELEHTTQLFRETNDLLSQMRNGSDSGE